MVRAGLVYDGGEEVRIPESMGIPCSNQAKGTAHEILGEIASRICYDSLGFDEAGKPRGRGSEQLHTHIREVRNHSVYEHANFTVGLDAGSVALALVCACLNRKGIWVRLAMDGSTLEITTNYRAILEWDYKLESSTPTEIALGEVLAIWGNRLAPQIVDGVARLRSVTQILFDHSSLKTEGLNADQAWVSLYVYGSRGFSHEMVRHRFSMSQRSTRYVDESGSPYVEHPLVTKFLAEATPAVRAFHREKISQSIDADRQTYDILVTALQLYGLNAGQDTRTARKQARGAARGYLGNALATEMIFSAPVSGWLWMLNQRASSQADAEIREVFAEVLPALQGCRYGDFFSDLQMVPSPDGLGVVLG